MLLFFIFNEQKGPFFSKIKYFDPIATPFKLIKNKTIKKKIFIRIHKPPRTLKKKKNRKFRKKSRFDRRKMARDEKQHVFHEKFRGFRPILSPSSRGRGPPTHPI
jgi:hypothetical protein